MGAWDSGPFGNDDALDFLDYLAELTDAERVPRIRAALEIADGYLEAPEACAAIAAAALVAMANGMPPDEALMSDEMAWATRALPADSDIRAQARAALARVGGADSEWRELWEEEGSLAEAATVLDGIRDHL
jgi:hypothetical protein